MRKTIAILLIIALVLTAGCAQKVKEQPKVQVDKQVPAADSTASEDLPVQGTELVAVESDLESVDDLDIESLDSELDSLDQDLDFEI